MRKYAFKLWLKNAPDKLKTFLVHSKSVILLIVVGLLLNVIPAKIALAVGLPLYGSEEFKLLNLYSTPS